MSDKTIMQETEDNLTDLVRAGLNEIAQGEY